MFFLLVGFDSWDDVAAEFFVFAVVDVESQFLAELHSIRWSTLSESRCCRIGYSISGLTKDTSTWWRHATIFTSPCCLPFSWRIPWWFSTWRHPSRGVLITRINLKPTMLLHSLCKGLFQQLIPHRVLLWLHIRLISQHCSLDHLSIYAYLWPFSLLMDCHLHGSCLSVIDIWLQELCYILHHFVLFLFLKRLVVFVITKLFPLWTLFSEYPSLTFRNFILKFKLFYRFLWLQYTCASTPFTGFKWNPLFWFSIHIGLVILSKNVLFSLSEFLLFNLFVLLHFRFYLHAILI